MHISDTFVSYAGFEKALNVFKKLHYVDYFIKDCKTISSHTNSHLRLANVSEGLKYYFIKLCFLGGIHKKKKRLPRAMKYVVSIYINLT